MSISRLRAAFFMDVQLEIRTFTKKSTMTRKCFLMLCCCFWALGLCAQQTSVKKPSRNPELEGIVLTYHADFLQGLPSSPVDFREWRSGGVSLSFLGNLKLGNQSRWSLAAGLGIANRHYFTNILDWTVAGSLTPDTVVIKNKHVVTTLELPVEFRFTTRQNGKVKPFKFVAGFNFGYVIGFRHKWVEGSLVNIISGDASNFALIDWRPGLTARVGYHRMAISGYYGLTDLFGQTAVYQGVRPWSIGLSLTL